MKLSMPYLLRDKDRHGNERLYFRFGGRKVRLRDEPGTVAFAERYEALRQQAEAGLLASATSVTNRPQPGTWRWLVAAYLSSSALKSLDPATQTQRRSVLEGTCREPVFPGSAETYAAFPLARLDVRALKVLRDRKVAEGHHTAANHRVKCIRYVMAWAVEAGHMPINRARDLRKVPVPRRGHRTWTMEDITRFEARHQVGTKARLALALMLLTGIRRSDVVRLGRPHESAGRLRFRPHKGRNNSAVLIDIPILPALAAAICAAPTGDLTYLVTQFGRPFTANGFGNWWRKRCDEAGLDDCSAHGLRKAAASYAAENGATVHQLMAIFGWLTLAEAERYTRAASRARLASDGMRFLDRGENGT